MTLCFATNNKNKIKEVALLLQNKVQIVSLADIGCTEEIEETGETFAENAFIKANYIYNKYHINCFADDSGLEVEALNGAPGVFSARYAGEHGNDAKNNELLLENLKNIPNRKARFVCNICLIQNGKPHHFEGEILGKINETPIGNHGFGYDPIFVPNTYNQSFAELDLETKNKISHRSKAINLLVNYLNSH
ncbi:MAG: RdgB/HAM1 family non-canonical purine NTP pyrophosphatase [Bacteroidota bacterium]|nr:RdgB/HAM1 family non-canonical purine NTP pyrophosphatase [Bacteroidota bacterium]